MIQSAQFNNAFLHISRLAAGTNPLDENKEVSADILNHPEIIRTMYTVKEILEQYKSEAENTYAARSSSNSRTRGNAVENDSRPVEFPSEIVERFKPKRDTTVTHFLHDAYLYADNKDVRQVAPRTVLDWLLISGYLENSHDDEMNVDYKKVTKKGEDMGFSNSRVLNGFGGRNYISVIFGETAQYFVVKNMIRIMNGEAPKEEQEAAEFEESTLDFVQVELSYESNSDTTMDDAQT